jgi:hypothetical protein
MRESTIENYLVNEVEKRGGIAVKLATQHQRSLPDRLVLLPEGKMAFAELKAPGKKPTRGQAYYHKKLRDRHYCVVVIDSKEGVDDFLNCLSAL